MFVLGGMERRRLREGETEAMGKNRVITIGRQLGSGGSYIGREVARRLGIECYDKRLIELACICLDDEVYEVPSPQSV